MKLKRFCYATPLKRAGLLLAVCGLLIPIGTKAGWIPLANSPAGAINGMLLLSDGTVMAEGAFTTNLWYRLTPDGTGGYTNGQWSTLASMHYTRLYFSTQVLTNGSVFVAGGEYGTGGGNSEIYNPLNNSWTVTAPGNVGFGDAESEMLPDGTVLEAPVGWGSYPEWATLIYNPVTNGWTYAGSSFTYQDEATWVKLPDNSILTIDPYNDDSGLNSERYIPAPGPGWENDAHLPVAMFNEWAEMGPGFLLPNGQAFFVGGTGHTTLYTPSGNTNNGTWTQGPDVPNGMVMQDAAGAMMANGNVLCAVSLPMVGQGDWVTGTSFYVYDYASQTWNTSIGSPTGGSTDNVKSYVTQMLDLPDGTVLYSHDGTDLYVYQPAGSPVSSGKPVINNVAFNPDGSVTLTGTGFNGISEGADYGDDFQPHSNYPIVQFNSGGSIYYARTYDWSSTGVMTGSKTITTQMTIPTGLPPGPCSMVVIANGIPSSAVTFDSPVWVDFNYTGAFQFGDYVFPFETLAQGTNAVVSGGTIFINADVQPSQSSETMTISKPMTIISVGGASTIGE